MLHETGQPVVGGAARALAHARARRADDVRRNIEKISYCYEKQLLANPGLEGTVNTQFFISPNGTVTTANASGVNGDVSGCVAGVIKGIEFPKPKGGGGVQVNYPFNFRPTGG